MPSSFHQPVLLPEVLEYLKVTPGKKYIDCTLGGGGHTQEILEKGGVVLGLDCDPEALKFAKEHLKKEPRIVQGNFKDLKEIAKKNGFDQVDGVLFDLGVSSYQLDSPKRGFSYQSAGPLDMRMDPALTVTAADLVNGLSQKELIELFKKFGEEPYSRSVARGITSARQTLKLSTCQELAQIVSKTKAKPARIFQALRIAVNSELFNLQSALPQALDTLRQGGRLVVISFHSLEDRIAKQTLKGWEKVGKVKIVTSKVVRPQVEEMRTNFRSRSAKLRAVEKL